MEKNEYEIFIPKMVDLGLPSGTLWADRNVGAEKPEKEINPVAPARKAEVSFADTFFIVFCSLCRIHSRGCPGWVLSRLNLLCRIASCTV